MGSFPTKTEARQCYQDAKTDQRRGQFFPKNIQYRGAKRLADAIDDYMQSNQKRSIQNDRRYEKFWKKRLPNHRLVNITADILETVKGELAEKLSNQTVLHYLKFLRHILNRAVKKNFINQNPFAQVEMPKVTKGRLRYLSMDEEQRLLTAIGPTYAPWVRFAILTGLRQAEQFQLKWTDIDLDRAVVTLPQTKAGECQYVYLSHEANDILKSFTSWKDSKWVFPSQNKGTPLDPKNFYHRVYVPALQKARLQKVKDDQIQNVDWHTLRHTFASRLGLSGVTERDIADGLRHSSTALVRRYTHLSKPYRHSINEKVSQFGRQHGNNTEMDSTVDKSEIEPEKETVVER
jgi:integrase